MIFFTIRPILMPIGDADGVRYNHALELLRAKGSGKMDDFHGPPKSSLAIIPGTHYPYWYDAAG